MIANGNGGLCGLHAQLRAERDCNIGIEQYVYTTLEAGNRVQERTQEEKNATKENVPQKTQQEDPKVIFFFEILDMIELCLTWGLLLVSFIYSRFL